MNLFVTSEDPVECAKSLDDKRLGKMLMEANQLLSSSIHQHYDGDITEHVGDGMICAVTHVNHPCAVWVRTTKSNFNWTLRHAYALGYEWTYRFDSFHGSNIRTQYIARFSDCLPSGDLLPFQNSARNLGLGIDFSHLPVPLSYRKYLEERWFWDKRPVEFTRRGEPSWLGS